MSFKEANVCINGHTLTLAQSMTLRVAIGSFLIDVNNPEFASELGPIGEGYRRCLGEISLMLHKTEV